MRGDFGYSLAGAGSLGGSRRPVADLIEPRLANTLFLAAVTAIIAVPLALILGMLTALYRNSLFDRIVNIVTLTSISSPEFFVAYILMLFLAIKLPIFHSLANVSPDTQFFERLGRIALPSLTLILVISSKSAFVVPIPRKPCPSSSSSSGRDRRGAFVVTLSCVSVISKQTAVMRIIRVIIYKNHALPAKFSEEVSTAALPLELLIGGWGRALLLLLIV